jgi:hypothetical protein
MLSGIGRRVSSLFFSPAPAHTSVIIMQFVLSVINFLMIGLKQTGISSGVL